MLLKFHAIFLSCAFLTGALVAAPEKDKDSSRYGEITTTVARMLESAHFSRTRLNQEVAPGVSQARRVLDTYLEQLDYNRLFFTQQDIDEFVAAYGNSLQDDILLGNLEPAWKIYDRLKERVADRVQKINRLLDQDFAFDTSRTVKINREKEPWPANDQVADQLWADRIEAELLQATLTEKNMQETTDAEKKAGPPKSESAAAPRPPRPPKETVRKRYERLLKTLEEETREDQATAFLSALARSYDPHSDYMSPRALDNFNIQMGLSLVGIGAVLRSDDGYAKVVELVPGGPADKGGKLKVNDRIVAVAQGNDEFEDVVDMKLDRVVERIRGKKGTTVRLQVQPAAAVDPSKLEVITIVREEVQLKDQQAKAQVIDVDSDQNGDTRIGWLTLPSFYANMNQKGQQRSTTDDVTALLKRLKKENIQGLVIDLRGDSGGSLDEAIRMTGLFIPRGPVVQVKDTNGNMEAHNDRDPGVLWDGPLVVLMNRGSASASEIFAAALQDYGRAVIVGDEQSFGKGTVQTLLDVQRFMPLFAQSRDAGAVKLTIQKFYRVKGGSTQLKGVASDIVLPSLTDQPEIGEGSLKNPLEYDEVPVRNYTAFGTIGDLVPQLSSASADRVQSNPDFSYILEDRERLLQRIRENIVSLNKTERMTEIEEDKARREARLDERKQRKTPKLEAYEITLDTVEAPKLTKVSLDKPPKKSYEEPEDSEDPSAPDEDEPFVDPVRDETLLIMSDLVRLQSPQPVTVKANVQEAATP